MNNSTALWLRLAHTAQLGPSKAARLLEQFGSIQSIFSASHAELTRAGLSDAIARELLDNQQTDSVNKCLDWSSQTDQHILTIDSPDYPAKLKEATRPPAVLYVRGNISALHDPQLAMVGSRSPSKYGADNAYDFAKHLSASGLTITSGLALGIDGHSHRGALATHSPTIAVVATGLDRVYPKQHKSLAQEILKANGAIVSEFTLGVSPKAEYFPQRNRIIAGLSLGTLVVEAALRSGSLITARCTRDLNREVFAIPTSIHNPVGKGCHDLIKQGAKLVETSEDILVELAPQLKHALSQVKPDTPTAVYNAQNGLPPQPSSTPEPPDSDHGKLLEAMGWELITIDELVAQTDFSTAEIASMLLILELEGLVNSEAGGRYQRA